MTLAVRDGVVIILGRAGYRSATRRMAAAARQAEGVIGAGNQLRYDIDDRFPAIRAGL